MRSIWKLKNVSSERNMHAGVCKSLKGVVVFSLLVMASMAFSARPVSANIPDIEGYIKVEGTNAPVVGVWVKLTNSASINDNCPSGTVDQSRFAKTDSSGKYTFVSWTENNDAVGEGRSIDTNLDGSNDAIQYPTFDSCEPGSSPGSIFACGRDPFKLEVIRPYNWSGSFDRFGTSVKDPCEFCLNNGTYTFTVPVTLFYHSSGGTGLPTSTPVVTSSPTITPTPVPSCSVTSSENPIKIPAGTSRQLTIGPVTISCSSGYSTYNATYTTDPAVIGTCGSAPCSGGTYTDTPAIKVVGTAVGPVNSTTPLTVTVADQVTGVVKAVGNFSIQVTNTNPWFQSLNGDLISHGSITTTIPASCVSPLCKEWLINYTTPKAAGVAIGFSGVTVNSTTGVVNSPNNWRSSAEYTGTTYDYGYFEKHASCGVAHEYDPANRIAADITYFTSFGTNAHGYNWVRYTGDSGNPLTIGTGSDINVGINKVILFVKNADVIIKSKIRVTPGRGFFMIVAGNVNGTPTGNIFVDPSVGDAPSSTPDSDLEGIYYTQEQFRTGTLGPNLDKQLYVRGSIAAFDKVVLQRNLTNNSIYPAELFEYAPEFLINYPECLGDRTTNWREEAP